MADPVHFSSSTVSRVTGSLGLCVSNRPSASLLLDLLHLGVEHTSQPLFESRSISSPAEI